MTAEPRKDRPVVVPSAARRWARANGIPVGPRGRLSAELLAEYRSAMRRHPSSGRRQR